MANRSFLNPDYLSRPLVPSLRSYSMMKLVGDDADSGEGNGFKSYLNTFAAAKLAAISKARWDPQDPFKKLHVINPTRVTFIRSTSCRHFRRDPYSSRLEILDVDCGDGTRSEASDPLISSMDSFSIAGYNPPSTYTEKLKLVQLFEQWMEKHQKSHAQPEDKIHAFENFVKNYEFVNQWNANAEKNGGHFCGLNCFSDLSNEEFKEIYMNYKLGEESKRRRGLGCVRNYGSNTGLEVGLAQNSGN